MKFNRKKDPVRLAVICLAAVLMAVNIKSFVRTGGLYPGGANGLTLLLQRIFEMAFDFEIPFTLVNLLLNAFPVYLGFRYIGKKFTLLSLVMIMLTNVLTDLLPAFSEHLRIQFGNAHIRVQQRRCPPDDPVRRNRAAEIGAASDPFHERQDSAFTAGQHAFRAYDDAGVVFRGKQTPCEVCSHLCASLFPEYGARRLHVFDDTDAERAPLLTGAAGNTISGNILIQIPLLYNRILQKTTGTF